MSEPPPATPELSSQFRQGSGFGSRARGKVPRIASARGHTREARQDTTGERLAEIVGDLKLRTSVVILVGIVSTGRHWHVGADMGQNDSGGGSHLKVLLTAGLAHRIPARRTFRQNQEKKRPPRFPGQPTIQPASMRHTCASLPIARTSKRFNAWPIGAAFQPQPWPWDRHWLPLPPGRPAVSPCCCARLAPAARSTVPGAATAAWSARLAHTRAP